MSFPDPFEYSWKHSRFSSACQGAWASGAFFGSRVRVWKGSSELSAPVSLLTLAEAESLLLRLNDSFFFLYNGCWQCLGFLFCYGAFLNVQEPVVTDPGPPSALALGSKSSHQGIHVFSTQGKESPHSCAFTS